MKNQFIQAYVRLERLPENIRLKNGIRSKERLDCTKATLNSYRGLLCFLNAKAQLSFYKTPCRDLIDASYKRRAEFALSNGKLNLSSIYIEDMELPQFGYGYPNSNRLLSNGTPNPLYLFSNDGYLFYVNNDYTNIEVFIIQDGRPLITQYYQQMLDGLLDDDINSLRSEAVSFYNYGL